MASVSVIEFSEPTDDVSRSGTAGLAVIVAVLTRLPVAEPVTVPLRVKVSRPLAGRFTVALSEVVGVVGHVAPPLDAQVQLVTFSLAVSTVSAMVTPVTGPGPLFWNVIVYELVWFGLIWVTPSVFVTTRSGSWTVVVTVLALLPETGSTRPLVVATAAVFETLVRVASRTLTLTVYTTVPLAAMSPDTSLMLPDPDGAGHPEPAQVQVIVPSFAVSKVSVTRIAVAKPGPRFVVVIV